MKKELKQLGEELKKERQAREIKLRTIVERTKININYLKSMEDGEFNFLPEPYPRNFLKLYLQQLGRNTEKYLIRYDDIKKISQQPTITDKDLLENKGKNNSYDAWSLLINYAKEKHLTTIIGGIIICVFVVIILLVNKRNSPIATNNAMINQSVVKRDSQLANFVIKKKELILKLIAKERTWLQIAIDDSVATEYIFDSGDSSTWYAKQKFVLRIGNGAGVRLYLNGSDLGALGKELEVIDLVINREGVHRNKL